MKLKNFEILPLIGLENLKFGITPDEVNKIIGSPDAISQSDGETLEDFDYLSWYYADEDVLLLFEGDNEKKLAGIKTSNPNFTLFGHKLFDLDEKKIISLMNEHNITDIDVDEYEYEDEDEDEKCLSFPEIYMCCCFQNDTLTDVSWYSFDDYDDDDDIDDDDDDIDDDLDDLDDLFEDEEIFDDDVLDKFIEIEDLNEEDDDEKK